MSLKKALTKMGLVEDTVSIPKAEPTIATKTTVPTMVPTTTVEIDIAISKTLQQSLQDNKLSGFDYLKFIAATDEMKTYGTPEDARYRMAFLAAKQVGVDKDSLVKSGQHYIDVLKQDETDFNAECIQFEKKEVQAKDTKIAELEAKLTSLNEQLTQANLDHTNLTDEVRGKRASLASRQAAFKGTLETFVGNIEANIAKINKYLP